MRMSAPCPACAKPISVLRVATAPTPLHIKCPTCMRPVRLKHLALALVVAGIVFGLFPGRWLLQEARVVGGVPMRALLISLGAVAVFDLLFSLLVINLGQLVRRD